MVVPPTHPPAHDGKPPAPSREWPETRVLLVLLTSIFLMLVSQVFLSRRHGPPLRMERDPDRQFDLKIDVNSATKVELMHLPGIGPSLADRILADRESRGPFTSPAELVRVPGIGAKTIERIVPYMNFADSDPTKNGKRPGKETDP